MARMHNPPHPGEVLRDGVFTGAGMTVTAFEPLPTKDGVLA